MMRPTSLIPVLAALACAALAAAGTDAAAQQAKSRVWDIPLGTPVGEMPRSFMLASCGTNGGPPSTRLAGFADFARCPVEPATGLREIWFSYDDEAEYVQRAFRATPEALGAWLANQLFGHPVIFSILVDEAGRMRGYRILSDPREDPALRIDADVVALPFRSTIFGSVGWTCVDLPAREGEEPIGGPAGRFAKESCKKVTPKGHVTLETHAHLKAGQAVILNPNRTIGENEFDVRVRVEVIDAELVR